MFGRIIAQPVKHGRAIDGRQRGPLGVPVEIVGVVSPSAVQIRSAVPQIARAPSAACWGSEKSVVPRRTSSRSASSSRARTACGNPVAETQGSRGPLPRAAPPSRHRPARDRPAPDPPRRAGRATGPAPEPRPNRQSPPAASVQTSRRKAHAPGPHPSSLRLHLILGHRTLLRLW